MEKEINDFGLAYHCYTDVSYLLLYDSTNILLALLGLGRAWHLGLMSEAWQGAVALGIMMLIIYCVRSGAVRRQQDVEKGFNCKPR